MKTRSWYIWLSVLAFAILWGNTVKRIMLSKKNPLELVNDTQELNLWLKALGQLFISIIGFIIIPMFVIGLIISFLCQITPNLKNYYELAQLLILYLLGVYITDRHDRWRNIYLLK